MQYEQMSAAADALKNAMNGLGSMPPEPRDMPLIAYTFATIEGLTRMSAEGVATPIEYVEAMNANLAALRCALGEAEVLYLDRPNVYAWMVRVADGIHEALNAGDPPRFEDEPCVPESVDELRPCWLRS